MLSTNFWLAGFIDADGHLFVNISKNSISCGFELAQSSIDKQGFSKIEIMELLIQYLKVKLGKTEKRVEKNILNI